MKGFLLPGVLAGGVVSGGVQQKVSTNSEVMKTNTSTIRLIYPQWQGGNVAAMVPEVKDPDDAARGYYLGAQLLDFLAPCGGQETLTAGDCHYCPKGHSHSLINGGGEDLVFFAVIPQQ